MGLAAKLVAWFIQEVRDELHKMDPEPVHHGLTYDPRSTTGGETERAAGWDHDRRPPVGFG